MVGEKIVTGDWDGQPIWRRKTAGEELADEIAKTGKKCESCLAGFHREDIMGNCTCV